MGDRYDRQQLEEKIKALFRKYRQQFLDDIPTVDCVNSFPGGFSNYKRSEILAQESSRGQTYANNSLLTSIMQKDEYWMKYLEFSKKTDDCCKTAALIQEVLDANPPRHKKVSRVVSREESQEQVSPTSDCADSRESDQAKYLHANDVRITHPTEEGAGNSNTQFYFKSFPLNLDQTPPEEEISAVTSTKRDEEIITNGYAMGYGPLEKHICTRKDNNGDNEIFPLHDDMTPRICNKNMELGTMQQNENPPDEKPLHFGCCDTDTKTNGGKSLNNKKQCNEIMNVPEKSFLGNHQHDDQVNEGQGAENIAEMSQAHAGGNINQPPNSSVAANGTYGPMFKDCLIINAANVQMDTKNCNIKANEYQKTQRETFQEAKSPILQTDLIEDKNVKAEETGNKGSISETYCIQTLKTCQPSEPVQDTRKKARNEDCVSSLPDRPFLQTESSIEDNTKYSSEDYTNNLTEPPESTLEEDSPAEEENRPSAKRNGDLNSDRRRETVNGNDFASQDSNETLPQESSSTSPLTYIFSWIPRWFQFEQGL